jgi:hypothetical protein
MQMNAKEFGGASRIVTETGVQCRTNRECPAISLKVKSESFAI